MRGVSKSLPKYRKHKASGQGIVTLDGKDFYLGPHGTKASKLEYDRLIGEWLANGRHLPIRSDNSPITIVQLCAEYWRFCKAYYVKNGKPSRVRPFQSRHDANRCRTRYRKSCPDYGRSRVTGYYDRFGSLHCNAIIQ